MKFSVRRDRGIALKFSVIAALALLGVAGCKANVPDERKSEASGATAPFMASMAVKPPQVTEDALPAEKTGGFDGKLAYEHVTKQVGFGPRPSGSQGIQQVQDYILSQLTSSGCTVDTDSFSADTPAGPIAMKNILVKIPGERQGIILLTTHYDTKKLDNFVGADDSGSSTGVMLEVGETFVREARSLLRVDCVLRWGRSGPQRMAGSRQSLRQPADGGEDGAERRSETGQRDDSGGSGRWKIAAHQKRIELNQRTGESGLGNGETIGLRRDFYRPVHGSE